MCTAEINRRQPAFLLLLIDQSYSMSQQWDADGKSKADMLALTVNRLLGNAVLMCTKGDDRIHDYFEVGVVGYGGDVTLALHGATPERPVLPISEVGRNPRRLDQVMRMVPDGAGGTIQMPLTMPVWVDPVMNGNTPMSEAFTAAEQVVAACCGLHPTSFPPIVINITDGDSTDGDPAPAAGRLRSARTDDGHALLFNVHLPARDSNEPHRPRREVVFPDSAESLPDGSAAQLFAMSSELPAPMAEAASSAGYAVRPGTRGFLCNAQPTSVVDFLDIGTRAATPTGLKELCDYAAEHHFPVTTTTVTTVRTTTVRTTTPGASTARVATTRTTAATPGAALAGNAEPAVAGPATAGAPRFLATSEAEPRAVSGNNHPIEDFLRAIRNEKLAFLHTTGASDDDITLHDGLQVGVDDDGFSYVFSGRKWKDNAGRGFLIRPSGSRGPWQPARASAMPDGRST